MYDAQTMTEQKTSTFFRNFRDLASHNNRLRASWLFRSAALSLQQDEVGFDEQIQAHRIKTIIDLRAERELLEFPYRPELLRQFNYVHVPFDPWDQPEWFRDNYQYGSNEEIAYRFFGMACKESIRKALQALSSYSDSGIVIHCHAGKDRTGILVTILYLLSEANREEIYADYLASAQDTRVGLIDIVLGIIDESGGLVPYLKSCGMTSNEIQKLKHQLTTNP